MTNSIQYVHHLNDGYAIDSVMYFVNQTGQHPSCVRIDITADKQKLFDYIESIASPVAEYKANETVITQLYKLKNDDNIMLEVKFNGKSPHLEFKLSNGFLLEVPESDETKSTIKEEGLSVSSKYRVSILYSLENNVELSKTRSVVDEIAKKINSLKIEEKPEEICKLNLVVNYGGSLDLQTFNIDPPELDLSLNYGKEFKEKHDYLISKLEDVKANKGLVLLHGEPGCGKTYYIRHLVKLLSKTKKVIYIPPDLAHEIASPHFLAFLLENPGSILVIEDAENIIRSRKNGQNQAVANLLNTTDGLLADCLKVQVVCTFNCAYEEVDEALKRKGRLIAEHKFNKLSKEQAQLVANSLELDLQVSKDMTLAEIYNHKDLDFKQEQKTKIGFNI